MTDVWLHDWIKGLLKEKMLERIVDEDLRGNYREEELEDLISADGSAMHTSFSNRTSYDVRSCQNASRRWLAAKVETRRIALLHQQWYYRIGYRTQILSEAFSSPRCSSWRFFCTAIDN